MTHEPDIVAVRDLPPGRVEPTDESVSRAWHALTRRQATPEPARARRRWLVPVAAAGVVLGLAVTGAALFAPGPADTPTAGLPTAGTPIDPYAALDALAAAGSTARPAPLAAGQLIYVHTQGVTSSYGIGSDTATMGREDHEVWLDPQGMIALSVFRDGVDLTAPETGPVTDPKEKVALEGKLGNPPDQIAEQRAALAENGPSVYQPTPAWLAALPPDPVALRAELLRGLDRGKWSADHDLFRAVGDLLSAAEPIVTAEVRVGLYRALAQVGNLTALDTTAEQRRVVAIRHTENGAVDEILFDPDTGRFLGRGAGRTDAPRAEPVGGVEPPVDPGVDYRAVGTFKIVSAVGRR